MSKPEEKKARLFKLVVTLGTLLLCLLVYYGFFKLRLTELDNYDKCQQEQNTLIYPFSNYHQIMNLGWTHIKRPGLTPTSYLNYDTTKPKGVFRIGVFGGSDTEGLDAGEGYDFPSLLQANFKRKGIDSVQVINFGTGGYGLGQMLLLRNYIGKKYDLDVTVVNLSYFYHFLRDLSFRLYDSYGPLHARYVINNGELKLIEIPDSTHQESYKRYYSFFPPSDFRRYEYKAPAILIPIKPPFNPFYYAGRPSSFNDLMAEAYPLYVSLLHELRKNSKRLIVLCNDEQVYSMHKYFDADTAVTFYTSRFNEVMGTALSLYASPTWHNSPTGNQLYADELFNAVTNSHEPVFTVNFSAGIADTSPQSISFDSLGFEFGQTVSHRFYLQSNGEITPEDWNRNPDYGTPMPASNEHAHNLLLLSQQLSDVCFKDFATVCTAGDTVALHISVNGFVTVVPVGIIEKLNPVISRVRIFSSIFTFQHYTVAFIQNCNNVLSDFRVFLLPQANNIELKMAFGNKLVTIPFEKRKGKLIKDSEVFKFDYAHMQYVINEDIPDESILSTWEIKPLPTPDILHLRTYDKVYINPGEVPDSGMAQNLLVYSKGRITKYPFLKIEKHRLQ